MGLFDKRIGTADTSDQRVVEYPFRKKSKMIKAANMAETADAACKQPHPAEEVDAQATGTKAVKSKASKSKADKSKDAKAKAGKSKAAKQKAGKSKTGKSKAVKAPVVEVLPAIDGSDADQAMSAPSLENVIITKARDLSRLTREDLLQLLLTQSKDAERLQDYLRDVADEMERYTDLNARLREKLDVKDEQIERLKGRLDDKDNRIAQMKVRLDELEVLKKEEERRSQIIVSAVEGVRGALEAFNVTADWHIATLRGMSEELDGQSAHAATPAHEPAIDAPGQQEVSMTDANQEPASLSGVPSVSQEPASPDGNSKAANA